MNAIIDHVPSRGSVAVYSASNISDARRRDIRRRDARIPRTHVAPVPKSPRHKRSRREPRIRGPARHERGRVLD